MTDREAIRALECQCMLCLNESFKSPIEKDLPCEICPVPNELQALHEREKQQWISVWDIMHDRDERQEIHVTHWMPLPEPPEDNEKQ